MNAKDINSVETLLKGLIHRAIVNSINFVVDKCDKLKSKPEEPDFIASLTLNFTSDFYNILKTVFTKKNFSVTGVFCHQKPIVDIGMSKDPELGDILFIYIYKDKRGNKKFNSLLFQAKKSRNATTTIALSDEHQLKLYSEWPIFTYKRAGKLNGKSRDIIPKTINDGAQYLLIDDHPLYGLSGLNGTFPLGCATPSKTLSLNNDLTNELINFLKFKSGRAFEDDLATTKDEWSKMIWEILQATKDKASKRMNAGIANLPRQNTNNFDGCCFFMTDTKSIFNDLHNNVGEYTRNNNFDNYFDEENYAPSVVLIECDELSEE